MFIKNSDLLQSSEGARVDFKEPLTKDNWLKFVDTYLKATGLKYKVDTGIKCKTTHLQRKSYSFRWGYKREIREWWEYIQKL